MEILEASSGSDAGHACHAGMLPDGSALPAFLRGKRVMQLDLGLLIAGAKERGELESRVTGLISEIRAAGDVVLMCVNPLPCHIRCHAGWITAQTNTAMSAYLCHLHAASQQLMQSDGHV